MGNSLKKSDKRRDSFVVNPPESYNNAPTIDDFKLPDYTKVERKYNPQPSSLRNRMVINHYIQDTENEFFKTSDIIIPDCVNEICFAYFHEIEGFETYNGDHFKYNECNHQLEKFTNTDGFQTAFGRVIISGCNNGKYIWKIKLVKANDNVSRYYRNDIKVGIKTSAYYYSFSIFTRPGDIIVMTLDTNIRELSALATGMINRNLTNNIKLENKKYTLAIQATSKMTIEIMEFTHLGS